MGNADIQIDDNTSNTQMWRSFRKMRQEKKASNRDASPKKLKDEGIKFDERNGGAHLIIDFNDDKIDFWPGTGKWIVRKTNQANRGVINLINHIKQAG